MSHEAGTWPEYGFRPLVPRIFAVAQRDLGAGKESEATPSFPWHEAAGQPVQAVPKYVSSTTSLELELAG